MFDTKQFEKINPQYFNIIMLGEHDVTVQSKNTGHYWYLHSTDYPAEGNCVIFHKHKASHPYHNHGKSSSLEKAIRSIISHDEFQLNGRKPLKIGSRKAAAP